MPAPDTEGAAGKTGDAEVEFADNDDDEAGALTSVCGPDDSGECFLQAAE